MQRHIASTPSYSTLAVMRGPYTPSLPSRPDPLKLRVCKLPLLPCAGVLRHPNSRLELHVLAPEPQDRQPVRPTGAVAHRRTSRRDRVRPLCAHVRTRSNTSSLLIRAAALLPPPRRARHVDHRMIQPASQEHPSCHTPPVPPGCPVRGPRGPRAQQTGPSLDRRSCPLLSETACATLPPPLLLPRRAST